MTAFFDLANNVLLTFRAASDIIKALIITVPPAFVLGLYALCIWSTKITLSAKPAEEKAEDEILYSMRRNPDGTLTTYRHEKSIMPVKIPSRSNGSDPVPLHLVKYAEDRTRDDDEGKS